MIFGKKNIVEKMEYESDAKEKELFIYRKEEA